MAQWARGISMEALRAGDKCRLSKKRSTGKGAMAMHGRSGKNGGPSFPRRCARLVKEQRARFYIVRRCVTMLVCWRDYS